MNFIKKEIAVIKNNKNHNNLEEQKNYYDHLMSDLDQIIKKMHNTYCNKIFIKKELFLEIPSSFLTKIIKPHNSSNIYAIRNDQGLLLTGKKNIMEEFKNYYKNLYDKASFNKDKLVSLFQCWNQIVTKDEINYINNEIKKKELKYPIISTDANKSIGPDRLSNLFYKKVSK